MCLANKPDRRAKVSILATDNADSPQTFFFNRAISPGKSQLSFRFKISVFICVSRANNVSGRLVLRTIIFVFDHLCEAHYAI
jgi:hypothetical protein